MLINSSIMGIAERAAIAYLLIGIVDFIYQKRRHTKQLKMSKQEVKEETRQQSAPPEVSSAIRRRQIQAARARMMAAIPQADVVVTNPTHYAVVLSYDGSHPAPIVVAKGRTWWPSRSGASPRRTTSRSCPTRRWRVPCTSRWRSAR